jgi:hypothetical protein
VTVKVKFKFLMDKIYKLLILYEKKIIKGNNFSRGNDSLEQYDTKYITVTKTKIVKTFNA